MITLTNSTILRLEEELKEEKAKLPLLEKRVKDAKEEYNAKLNSINTQFLEVVKSFANVKVDITKATLEINELERNDKYSYWYGYITINADDLSRGGYDLRLYIRKSEVTVNYGTWGEYGNNKQPSYKELTLLAYQVLENEKAIIDFVDSLNLTFIYAYDTAKNELSRAKWIIDDIECKINKERAKLCLVEGCVLVETDSRNNKKIRITRVMPKTIAYVFGDDHASYKYNEETDEYESVTNWGWYTYEQKMKIEDFVYDFTIGKYSLEGGVSSNE